jgi:hypothetical protein
MFGFFYFSGFSDYFRQEVEMENRRTHREFIENLLRKQKRLAPEAKSISLLTRAVNRPKLRTHIRQPAWRAGRWKSLT